MEPHENVEGAGLVTLTRPPYYRQSSIGVWDSCPRRQLYSMQNVLRSPSPMAAGGTLNHRFFHKAQQEMYRQGEDSISVEQAMEIYAHVLTQSDVPSGEVVPISMKQMKWGRVIAVKWAQTVQISIKRVVSLESRLYCDVSLPNGEKRTISGQLDLLLADPPDGCIVVDWKSGFARPKQPRDLGEPAEDKSEGRGLTELGWAQALIYAFLVFGNYPTVQRVTFREWHVLWGEAREMVIHRYEMERLTDVLAAQVALMDQAIAEGEDSPRWVASPGPHCAMCSGVRLCPVREQFGIPETLEEASRLAGEWVVAGAARSERLPLLKGYVDAYGPIEVPHSKGRRVVGWDTSEGGKRSFGVFEPKPDESPFDGMLTEAMEGLLQ